MKPTLVVGLTHTHRFTVTEDKTVPNLYPESPAFAAMPKVFATGFLVGFIEWACLEALKPHLDDGEGSLDIHIDVDHRAATRSRSSPRAAIGGSSSIGGASTPGWWRRRREMGRGREGRGCDMPTRDGMDFENHPNLATKHQVG